jgi:hypothetical protein
VTVNPARIGALQYLSAAEPKAQTPRARSLLHTLEMALRSYILGLTAGSVPGPSAAITAGFAQISPDSLLEGTGFEPSVPPGR